MRLAVNSEELAQEVMSAVVAVQARILGVGKEQYDEGSQQKFESMSLQEIITYAMEEVEDGIAYNVMLRYKLTLLRKAVDSAFTSYADNQARHAKHVPVTFDPQPPVVQAPAYALLDDGFDAFRAPHRLPTPPEYRDFGYYDPNALPADPNYRLR